MRLSPSAHTDTFCRDSLPPLDQWPRFRFDLPELAYPDRLNCAEVLLDQAVERWGEDRLCLITPGERWTYGQLRRRASQIAQVLTEDRGLVPGNRVLLRGPNNPWLVAAWFGVIKAGCVAVTTMPLLRGTEIRTLHELTRTSLALCDHRFVDDLHAGVPELPLLGYGSGDGEDLIRLCDGKSGEFTAAGTAADDVALLAPTSGTTGRPKATMHFHRDVLANADTFARYVLKPAEDEVFTGTPPLGFTFGLGGLVVFPFRFGAASLLLEKPGPDELVAAIAEHGATVLFTAPTAYKAILATGKASALPSLRRCVSAGEHLPAEVWAEFHRQTGLKIINGIGGTELLHIFISAADDDIRPGSTGRVVPGFEAVVLDDDGSPVPDGQPGRLAVCGPTGCRYLADPRQQVYVQDGWNITGDTYVRDADGYFWYQARNDDMIISAGYNIAGPEVEEALLAHPDVVEAAVVGAPDEHRGTIVMAFVVLRPGVDGDERTTERLQTFVKHAIAPYKYPREIEFVAELPRTVNGKLQRYLLRERARTRS
ncbi:2-aminobenzoate-CoA ligase [Saccharopolyspora erythraea NRRL 2338]|uniref:AMP-dependent acetyl-coenzyme A synthetase and ligase n=1 Tax=Saccharopolyspora erythraea (strain ATCC 11635 / DSM 40517 / JCM 4748 / NBRC 13426 / NCIMB 8594 / NRRL 2338) TaxID=405948 RepID=A4FED4_SACEN|nr:AMP-binding protein [Saccharopolyspora erythraea]EQD83635.1 AMP-dependent synthetase [Saccharopolyspora erythraea D]PFG96134.1 2-aminobenzoate-CoA ligase [Saccharopolyspora erythraea NRRL 2338]QRK92671.1 AMP-binding protein [Saccharopolyspora erythraea]CAM02409.1 AMP-dependent acetyl-coenzyme A synthetase and ligase [Saccharopolyspora erythraea NRRL 2338]